MTATPSKDRLTFVHLSDIHFRKGTAGTIFDIDQGLRDAIGTDIEQQLHRLGCAPNGILITGDIAFGGKKEEYAFAKEWLQAICARLGKEIGDIAYCVPGNHDVDREVIQKSVVLRDAHAGIRGHANSDMDSALKERLQDAVSGALLFSAHDAYNREFAWGLECHCDRERPYWEHEEILNDGSILRIRGLTSSLLSSKDKEKYDLFLGRVQAAFRREPNVQYLTMCHHPPDWCHDQDQIEDELTNGAMIQLFGHKHAARVRRINDTVRIVAGAVHPDRKEDWKPGYNLIQVWVEGTGSHRRLKVNVHAREWQEAPPSQFKPYLTRDGGDTWEFDLPLPSWNGVELEIDTATAIAVGERAKMATKPADRTVEGAKPTPSPRAMLFRFAQLPYSKQVEIVTTLGLIEDEDKNLPDIDRFLRAFKRATERNSLDQLLAEIAKAEAR